MYVEKQLSKLENKAADIINKILNNKLSEIILKRNELYDLKKFLFIMSFRSNNRRNQYINNKFDIMTSVSIKSFMEKHYFDTPEEVWLNDIKNILDTDYDKIVDSSKEDLKKIYEGNFDDYLSSMLFSEEDSKISPNIRNDIFIEATMFICIWKTNDDSEFVVSDNSFGLFEGDIPGVYYHTFYVLSPNTILVLSNKCYHKDGEILGMLNTYYNNGFRKSWFDISLHDTPIVKYKNNKFIYENHRIKYRDSRSHDNDDEFTYKIRTISKDTVNLINSIILNHTEDLITFKSEKYLYKSIKYYNKVKENRFPLENKNYDVLKNILVNNLNKTHI
jgi:hypothetical protein